MLGISLKNSDIIFKYLGSLHSHLRNKVMIFNPRKLDEACVQTRYLENIDQKKEHPSGSKKKDHPGDSKEGKKKWKGGKYKKIAATTHQ
jgi:hypothetical protein